MTTQNEFDASQFRLDNLVSPSLVTETLLTGVPVQKPPRQQFIRVHPDADYYKDVALLEVEQEREHYLVATSMLGQLEGEYRPVRLVLAMSRHGHTPFLWPLKLPSSDGRSNLWNETAMMAAEAAKTSWVRVVSDQSQGMYRTIVASGEFQEPEWPEATMDDLLEKAFKGRMIMDVDHPIVRSLQGEL